MDTIDDVGAGVIAGLGETDFTTGAVVEGGKVITDVGMIVVEKVGDWVIDAGGGEIVISLVGDRDVTFDGKGVVIVAGDNVDGE
jgi:hypothetical protein